MELPYETRQAQLYALMSVIKSVSSNMMLQNVVFLSQKIGAIDNIYDFHLADSPIGTPYSPSLELDLLSLENQGYLYDTGSPECFTLTMKPYQLDSSPRINQEKFEEILQMDYDQLKSVAKVIQIKDELEHAGISDRSEIINRTSDYLFISRDNVQQSLDYIE